jgi:hypothetical protein
MERPGERAASVFRFEDVDGSVVGQESANHRKVAVPGGVVQGCLAIVKGGIGGPTAFKQEFDGASVVADCRADDATGGVGAESSEERRVPLEDLLDGRTGGRSCGATR